MRKRDGRKTVAVAQQPQVSLNMMQEMARFFMSSLQAGPQQNGIPGLQILRPVPNGAQRPLTHGSTGSLQIRAPVQQQSEPFQMQAGPPGTGAHRAGAALPDAARPHAAALPDAGRPPMDLMQQEPTVPAQPSQMQAAPWTRTSPHAMAGSVWAR